MRLRSTPRTWLSRPRPTTWRKVFEDTRGHRRPQGLQDWG